MHNDNFNRLARRGKCYGHSFHGDSSIVATPGSRRKLRFEELEPRTLMHGAALFDSVQVCCGLSDGLDISAITAAVAVDTAPDHYSAIPNDIDRDGDTDLLDLLLELVRLPIKGSQAVAPRVSTEDSTVFADRIGFIAHLPELINSGDPGDGQPGGASNALVGDYNGNGAVDAADYTVWRDTFGSSVDLRADGNFDSLIDQGDFDVWAQNFGHVAPGEFYITGPPATNSTSVMLQWRPSQTALGYYVGIHYGTQPPALGELPDESVVVDSNYYRFNNFSGPGYFEVYAYNETGATTLAANSPFFVDVSDRIGQVVFVTSTNMRIGNNGGEYPPDRFSTEFNDVATADYLVTQSASNSGLLANVWDQQTIYFTALIANSLFDLQERGIKDQPFYNVAGQLLANNLADLLAGQLQALIYTEFGFPVSGTTTPVWSGANPDGSFSGLPANDWGDTTGSATIGRINTGGTSWLSSGTRPLNLGARLYAFADLAATTVTPQTI